MTRLHRVVIAALAVAFGAGAHGTETERGLAHSVWFAPPGPEDPTPPPLTVQDQIRYCAIAELWSRRVWEMTDGSHHIYQVNFYSDYDASPYGRTVIWRRWDGEANASALGSGSFEMYEGARKCDPVFEQDGDGIGGFLECPEPGHTCSSDALEDYRYARCFAGDEPVLQTPEELAWTMAHEIGHADYYIEDEYATIDFATFPICLGSDENAGTDETSMMAWRGRNHWCDLNTHLETRVVLGPDGLPVLDANGEPFELQSAGIHEKGTWGVAEENAWRWVLQPLEYSGSYDTMPPYPGVPISDPEDGSPVQFCNFFSQGDGQPINDALVLLDKSGSMDFRNPAIENGPTALAAAYESALSFYNSVREDRLSGILAFDTAITVLEEYGLRGDPAEPGNMPEPDGGTDICRAIRDGTEAIRAEANSFDYGFGQLILLSDGMPTATDCDSAEEVLQAASEACNGGEAGSGVAVNTIAFGDADRALMRQVAEFCEARTTALLVPASPFEIDGEIELREDPLDVRTTLTRSGRFARSHHELLNRTAIVNALREDAFIVPPGSQETSVEWIGDGFEFTFFNDSATLDCRFSNLDFDLVAPDGEVISDSASPIPGELTYRTRTLRVMAPMPGEWTARIRPHDDFVCFPGSAVEIDYGDYDPRVTVVASVLNASFTPDVMVTPTVAPRDGTIRIAAAIDMSPNARATGIDAVVRITGEDQTAVDLVMSDDGTGGDETAADGIFTALFNPAGSAAPAGGYRVLVSLEAEPGTAQPTLAGDGVVPGAARALPSVPALRYSVEDSFVLRDCTSRGPEACPDAGAEPTDPSPFDSCAIALAPGESRQGLEVVTRNLALGVRNVTVSLGIGVRVRNVETVSYDPATRTGRVRFDATATPDAPDRPRHVRVGFAGRSVTSRGCTDGTQFLHAAAFLCGQSDETSASGLAAGRYETTITIGNQSPDREAAITTAVARSLPRQLAGTVTEQIPMTVEPGQSSYVGCDEIRTRLPQPMTEQLRSGYLLILSDAPVVVSSAYSARSHSSKSQSFDVEPVRPFVGE